MEVICRGRRGGKTIEAIKKAVRNNYTLVCCSANEVERVQKIAKELGVEIPQPITFSEFTNGSELKTAASGYVIDNVDMLLQKMAGGKPIRAITATYEPRKNPYIIDDPEYTAHLKEWDPKQKRALLYGEWAGENTGEIELRNVDPISPETQDSLTIPAKRRTGSY